MLKPHLRYVARELVGRKARTITNLLAIAIPVAIFMVMSSVMNAYSAAIYQPFKDIGADMIVQRSMEHPSDEVGEIRLPFGKGLFSQDTVDKIAGLPHVKDISKALVIWRYDHGQFTTIEGIEPGSAAGSKYNSWLTAGHALTGYDSNGALLEKHFANFYMLKPGDTLQLDGSTFKIAGVVSVSDKSQVSASNVYINLKDAQALLGEQGYSQLYITLDSLESEKTVRSEISGIDKFAMPLSAGSIAASLSNYMDIYNQYRALVLLVIAAVLALVLFQVNITSIMERKRDIGILQTVGWTKKEIGLQITSEVLLQVLLGFMLGILISGFIVAAIGSISIQARFSQGLGNDLSTLSAPLQLPASAVWQFFVVTLLIALGLGLYIVRKLAGMKPLSNLKNP